HSLHFLNQYSFPTRRSSDLDAISSQHSCIHPSYKKTEGNFQRAANGMPTVGFSLQAVWTTVCGPVSKFSQKENYIVQMAKWLSLDRKSTRLNSSHVSISYAV